MLGEWRVPGAFWFILGFWIFALSVRFFFDLFFDDECLRSTRMQSDHRSRENRCYSFCCVMRQRCGIGGTFV